MKSVVTRSVGLLLQLHGWLSFAVVNAGDNLWISGNESGLAVDVQGKDRSGNPARRTSPFTVT